MVTRTKVKVKTGNKAIPSSKIAGNHLAAIAILREMYESYSAKDARNRNFIETSFMVAIEKAYGTRVGQEEYTVQFLCDEVFKILNQKKEWNIKEQELYELFSKAIFLRAWSGEFKSFFQNMQETIAATMQLDFTKRVPLTTLLKDDNNVFNYGAVFLNLIIEKMQKSVVSKNAINSMFSVLPGHILLVTNKTGDLRFINGLGEQLLGVQYNDVIDKPIRTLLPYYSKVDDRLKRGIEISDMEVDLPIANNWTVPVLLTVKRSGEGAVESKEEVEEFIYVMKLENAVKNNLSVDVIKELHDNITSLNTTSETIALLKMHFIDLESKKLISKLEKNISDSKKKIQKTLSKISPKLP